jgi:hypothetical protein
LHMRNSVITTDCAQNKYTVFDTLGEEFVSNGVGWGWKRVNAY